MFERLVACRMPGIPDVEKDAARRIGVKGRERKREGGRERETLHVGLARFSGGQWKSPCYQYCLFDAGGATQAWVSTT